MVANWIANLALKLPLGSHLLELPLMELYSFLQADVMGVSLPRLVH